MPVPKFTAVFTRLEEGGFYATVREAPEVNTEGATLEQAATNLVDALALVLVDRLQEGKLWPGEVWRGNI